MDLKQTNKQDLNLKKVWASFVENPENAPLNFFDKNKLKENLLNNASILKNKKRGFRTWEKELTAYPLSTESQKNFDDLKKGNAVVVITGQQPCLLTGPSLVLHKTFTTISICRYLKSIGVRAVPVFWNASEDHDLSEILRVSVLEGGSKIRQKRYKGGLDKLSAESLKWDAELDGWAKECSFLTQELLKKCPRRNYADHFNTLMLELFADDGLLVVEPKWLDENQDLFWKQVNENKNEILEAFKVDEDKIRDRGGVCQVERRHPFPIFRINTQTGERVSVKFESDKWLVGGSEPVEQLADLISDKTRLSTGALLRPAFAQFQLPILVSVLGPAEYKYHQQNKSLFSVLKQYRPLLYPRLGGTFVSESIKEICDKIDVDVEKLITEGFAFKENPLMVDDFQDGIIENQKNILKKKYPNIAEKDLQGAIHRFRSKLNQASEILRRQLWKVEQRERGLSSKQLKSILDFLKPKGVGQERTLCAMSFIKNKEHFKAIQEQFSDCFDFTHRVYS